MRLIPKKIFKLYEKGSIKDKLHIILRWSLCPFEKLELFLPKNGLIYDIGCGHGLMSNYLKQKSDKRKIIGFDLNRNKIKIAKSTNIDIKFVSTNVNKYPFKKFNGAIMSDFLHHIDYKTQEILFKKLYKFCKKNGIIVLQDVAEKPRLKYLIVNFLDHILNIGDKIYYRKVKNMKNFLENIGFKVKIIPAHKKLLLSDIIYLCTKN